MGIKENQQKYYLANRETLLAKNRERYRQNIEFYRERYRAWYAFNIEHKKQYDKERSIRKKLKEQEKFVISFDD